MYRCSECHFVNKIRKQKNWFKCLNCHKINLISLSEQVNSKTYYNYWVRCQICKKGFEPKNGYETKVRRVCSKCRSLRPDECKRIEIVRRFKTQYRIRRTE